MAKAHFTLAQGTLPTNATKAGKEADGTALYVARVEYEGGHHPGKYREGWRAASISYGGREVWVPEFYVWTGLLTDGSPGQWVPIPAEGFDPVWCGAEHDLTPLYAARVHHAGSLQLGKWRKGWTAASIPYGGQELWLAGADVLCPGVPLD
jgi:DM9 repeat